MHAISSYRGNKPTKTHTNAATNTQTAPITIHCTVKISAQCNVNGTPFLKRFFSIYLLFSSLILTFSLLPAYLYENECILTLINEYVYYVYVCVRVISIFYER